MLSFITPACVTLFISLILFCVNSGGSPLPYDQNTIIGNDGGFLFGNSISLGDFNNDGYDDLAIGEPSNFLGTQGAVYIYLGSSNGLREENKLIIHPPDGIWKFGQSLAMDGDCNGDGYDDLVVSGYHIEGNTNNLFIVLGTKRMQNLPMIWNYSTSINQVEYLGDLNNDNFDDVIVGNYFLFYGSEIGFGPNPTDRIGMINGQYYPFLTELSDIDNDGYGELIVGKNNEFYILGSYRFGISDEVVWNFSHNGYPLLGHVSAGSLGDVNLDGIDDFALGLYDIGNGFEDRILLFYSDPSLSSNTGAPFSKIPSHIISQTEWNTSFGANIRGGEDLNNDDALDLIVTAPRHSSEGYRENGRVYFFFGDLEEDVPSTTFSFERISYVEGDENRTPGNPHFPYSITPFGDVNNDSIMDVGISDIWFRDRLGKVVLLYGYDSKNKPRPDVVFGIETDVGLKCYAMHRYYNLSVEITSQNDAYQIQYLRLTFSNGRDIEGLVYFLLEDRFEFYSHLNNTMDLDLDHCGYINTSGDYSILISIRFHWNFTSKGSNDLEAVLVDNFGTRLVTTEYHLFYLESLLIFSSDDLSAFSESGHRVDLDNWINPGNFLDIAIPSIVYNESQYPLQDTYYFIGWTLNEDGRHNWSEYYSDEEAMFHLYSNDTRDGPNKVTVVLSLSMSDDEVLDIIISYINIDVSQVSFSLYEESVQLTSRSTFITISIQDLFSGVNASTIEYSIASDIESLFDLSNPVDFYNGFNGLAAASISIDDTDLHYFQWRAYDNAGNGPNVSLIITLRFSMDISFAGFKPNEWSNSSSCTCSVDFTGVPSSEVLEVLLGYYIEENPSLIIWNDASLASIGDTALHLLSSIQITTQIIEAHRFEVVWLVRVKGRSIVSEHWTIWIDDIPVEFGDIRKEDFYIDTRVSISIQASDSESGVNHSSLLCRINGSDYMSDWQHVTLTDVNWNTFEFEVPSEGTYSCEFRCYDNVRNGPSILKGILVLVDLHGVTFIDPDPSDNSIIIGGDNTFHVTVYDNVSGVSSNSAQYRILGLELNDSPVWMDIDQISIVGNGIRISVIVVVDAIDQISIQYRCKDIAHNKYWLSVEFEYFINQPPRSIISSPTDNDVLRITKKIHFEGSDSFDPEGDELSYYWDVSGIGFVSDDGSFDLRLPHGEYQITLIVADSFNQTDSSSISVIILNNPSNSSDEMVTILVIVAILTCVSVVLGFFWKRSHSKDYGRR